jgi:hypothetical protein
MFESIKKPLNPNQIPESTNETEENLPRLVDNKVKKKAENLRQKIGGAPRSVKLTGFAGRKPTFDVWLTDIDLQVLEWLDYQSGVALIHQGAVGNCWLVAVLKALLDSGCSAEFCSYALGFDNDNDITFSFPSQDPKKRQTIKFKGDKLARYSAPAVYYLFQGMSEHYDQILQPYKAADRQRSEDTDTYLRVLKEDITATTDGHFEEEPMYRTFKYLSDDFTYIKGPISTSRLDFLMATHFAYSGIVLGVISFSKAFTTESVTLNSESYNTTEPMYVLNRHAYYLKSFHDGIATLMNPHHLSEQIHISIEDIQKHFQRIFIAKITDFKSESNIFLSRTVPLYISQSIEQNSLAKSCVRLLPKSAEAVSVDPSLYPYLPGYNIFTVDNTFYLFQHQGKILAYDTYNKILIESRQSTSTTFMDSNFNCIEAEVVHFEGEYRPTILSFYKGYLGVESAEALDIQCPKISSIQKSHNIQFTFDTPRPFSVQVLSHPNDCELTFVETSSEVLIFANSEVHTTTKDCFQVYYSTDTGEISLDLNPEEYFYDKNGVYITYWFGELNIDNFGEAQSILML